FDVKLHRLLSRHAADLRSLPPDLRDGAETDERGRVRLTSELEASMIDAILEATAPLEDERRLATFLLQLTPAFAPRSHQPCEPTAATPRAISTAAQWPSASSTTTPTTSCRRSPAARATWPPACPTSVSCSTTTAAPTPQARPGECASCWGRTRGRHPSRRS